MLLLILQKKFALSAKTPKADRPFNSSQITHSHKETGFLLNLSSSTQYYRKNPVSQILINDCGRAHHDYARDPHENARDHHDYDHDRYENVRDPGQPNSDSPPQHFHSTTLQFED